MLSLSHIKYNIRKIYVYKFFVSLNFVSAILVPFFSEWGGLDFSQIMFLQSWFMLWIFLLEIPTGAVADYFGRKYSLFLCSVFYLISFLVYISEPNFYIFLIAEFLSALAFALYSGADEALLYDSLKQNNQENISKKIFGRAGSFNLGGIMTGSLLGGVIASQFGLKMPMLLMVIPAAINIFIALSLKEPTRHKKSDNHENYINILKNGIKFFYNHKILKIIVFDMLAIASIAYFIIWLFQEGLQQNGLNLVYFGIVQAIFIGIQVVIMNNYERCEKLFKSKTNYLLFSGLTVGIAFVIAGLFMHNLIIIVCMFFSGFALSRKQLMSSYINKHIPSEQRATVLSTISMFGKLILIFIIPIVGFMVDWSLNYALIIIGAIAIILSFLSRIKERYLVD